MERRYLMIKSEKACGWEYRYKNDVEKFIKFFNNTSAEEIVKKIDFGSEYRKPFSDKSLYKNERNGRAEKVEKLVFKFIAHGNEKLLYSFWAMINSILLEFNSTNTRFRLSQEVERVEIYKNIFSYLFSNCFSEDEKKIILSFIFKVDDIDVKVFEEMLTGIIEYYLKNNSFEDGFDNEILNFMFSIDLKVRNNQVNYSLFFDLSEENFKILDTSNIYEIYGDPYEGNFDQYPFIAKENELMIVKDLELFSPSLLNKDSLPFFSNLMKFLSKYILRDYQGYQLDDKMFESLVRDDPDAFKAFVFIGFDKLIKRNFDMILLNNAVVRSEMCYGGTVPAYPELYEELKERAMISMANFHNT